MKLFEKSLIFLQKGNLIEAKKICEFIIKREPLNSDALHLLGVIEYKAYNYKIAELLISKAILINPNNSSFYSNLGHVLKKINKIEDALFSYDKAISLKPDYAEAYHNRGIVLKELNKIEEALSDYDKAISLKPDYAEAYHNRGIVLKELNKIEEALSDYDKAISLKPDSEKFYCSRGVSLTELKKLENALSDYDKAISLKPDYAEAYHNRGIVLKELNKIEEALSDYDKAISLKPDYAEFYWNKSLVLLLKGDYKSGFKLYEKRWDAPSVGFFNYRKNFSKPFWDGTQDLKNKTILLLSEQGLGDTIQFCRYIDLVKNLGAKVLFQVPKKLFSLLKNLKSVDQFLIEGNALPKYDYYCTLLSLPFAFRTEIKTIPFNIPYLNISQDRIIKWKNYLGRKDFKIAINWQGGKSKVDSGRSFPLKLFKNISNIRGIRLISLQKNEGSEQLIDGNLEIQTLPKNFDNSGEEFLDSAAIMKSVDLVITGDTSLTHLAGALGVNTWLALKHVPDWRWLIDKQNSPWYACHRIFRQKKLDDWQQVFLDMEKEIKILLKQ
jgi:tetratricopeptide (TPR) repeat protein